MSDFLLELGRNPQARRAIKAMGLPIPIPEALRRTHEPTEARPLADVDVVVGAAPGSTLGDALAVTLAAAGANPHVVGDAGALAPFAAPGESYGRPARLAPDPATSELRPGALVFDATGIVDADGLRALYDFFHPWIAKLGRSSRVVVVGRPALYAGATAAAARGALEGFVRSVAKEIGRVGATANLVRVADGAEERLAPLLRFLLSPRSAYVTGQPIDVSTRLAAPPIIPETRQLEGKVALVTGAARGIGAATAAILAAEGARVVCLDRPADDGPLSQVAREVGGAVLLADVSDPGAPAHIAGELAHRHGGVDVVVHNAGITRDKTLARMKPEHWDQVMTINLAAVGRITDALLAGPMKDHGRIVCLSSIAGIAGNVGQTNYAASKGGVAAYVRSLSAELAPRAIGVNAIAPGFIETRLTAAIPFAVREVARRMSALGQGGLPEDVGQAIAFLATPGSYGLTGAVLRVCGGSLVGA